MRYNTITAAYFSPTGETGRIVRMTAEEAAFLMKADGQEMGVTVDDLTLPSARQELRSFGNEDLLILGTPTYAGRVPNKIAPEIRRLFHGEGTPVVPVVTFGNRSYDNSLAELTEILRQNGFVPVGAAAVCAPHAFSDILGAGRPDEEDQRLLRRLVRSVCAFRELQEGDAAGRLQRAEGRAALSLQVPGDPDAPYYTPLGTNGKPAKFLKAVPKTDPALCRHCGTCAAVCPMGSVSAEDPSIMTGICIKCQACVRKCPSGARYFDDAAFLSHVSMLEQTYARSAKSEIFCLTEDAAGRE